MADRPIRRLGLFIRSGPMAGRSNRNQLDFALAAAALEIELELYFLGEGVTHLFDGRDGTAAGLPSTAAAWRSLAEMTRVRAWLDTAGQRKVETAGQTCVIDTCPADAGTLAQSQAQCDLLLVL